MTILGIGVDILHIPRLTALLSRGTVHRNRRFIERICSQYDHQLLQTRFSHLADPATSIDVSNTAMVMHLAKVWTAKEAVYKAAQSSGIALQWNQVSIEMERNQPPRMLIDHERIVTSRDHGGRAHLSFSHDGDYLVAMVVLEC